MVESRIDGADIVSERAFHFYGGARRWVADRLRLPPSADVLDVGYGQGLFSIELASRTVDGRVVGVDFHADRVTAGTTLWYSRNANVLERVRLVQCDAVKLPFKDACFDFVATFLGAQDIEISRGDEGLYQTIREMQRVTRIGGGISITDDCFPECRPESRQGILFDAMRKHWRTLLPPIDKIKETMEELEITELSVTEFQPEELIPPPEAERELRMAVHWAKPQGVDVDFEGFWRKAGHIVREEGRHYPKLLLLTGTRAQ